MSHCRLCHVSISVPEADISLQTTSAGTPCETARGVVEEGHP